jgi:superfamily II RNA helicase
MMPSLTVIDAKYTGSVTFGEYPFELSDFQKNAIDAYLRGDNVFIAAPTGSGKTLPAEHALRHAINSGKKTIYTSPIKTLSNQKFKEFTDKFPDADVGILTGDIKYNPNGNLLIMTTEILRNLLFNKKIQDIENRVEIEIDIQKDFSLVIFDEIHYINDIDRGKVWEESIILLPDHIQLMMLSATIDNPTEFCDWIRVVKNKNIVLSSSYHRVVPLRHAIYTHYLDSYMKKTKEIKICSKYNNELTIISDERDKFYADKYHTVIHNLQKTQTGLSRTHVYKELIDYLTIHNMTPCILFCFSRKKCEQLAKSLPQSLLITEELSELRKVVYFNLRKCDQYASYIKLAQYDTLMKCLERGVAYHHSGLLPVFKEIVEILYSKYLVKVLFATETFAVGVNMPTKTVVFTSLEKFSGDDFRNLYTHEYLQMGGRAGRRGIDKVGTVILLPNLQTLPNNHVMNNLINGSSQTIKSKFSANYKLLLKVMLTGSSIDNIVNKSLLNTEVIDEATALIKEISEITIPDTDFSLCEQYDTLVNPVVEGFIKISQSVMKKNRKQAAKLKYSDGFEDLYKHFMEYKPLIHKKLALQSKLENNGNYIYNEIYSVLRILLEYGYINNIESLTRESVSVKGIIASEINECNEILLTELIYNGYLDGIGYKDIGAILAMFADSRPVKSSNDSNHTDAFKPSKYVKQIDFIEDTANNWRNTEITNKVYINSKWDINTYLMEGTYKWLDGSKFEEITQEYSLFEGNLIKDFIKIYNLSAEVERVAEILSKSDLQIEAAKIRQYIIRDIVNIESLYVK